MRELDRFVAPAYQAPPTDELERDRVRAEARAQLFGHSSQQIRIGRYLVDGQMGQGANGIVYRAHDEQLRRNVALKLLNVSIAQTEQHGERLMREARAMAQLSHPNVVVVHEIGTHEGRLFIAMELLEGGTLGQWVKAAPRDWRTVSKTLVGAGRGLEAAHGLGLVHRDLKPDNILIGSDGRARIVDFGLVGQHAQIAPTGPNAGPVASMTLTATGALLGTPAYMAPEQLMGESADALSDQFAFCATAYEALFGRRPFEAETFVQLVHAVTTGQVVPPPPNRIPGLVVKAILRGLAVDPRQRHSSMTALLATLEGALGPSRRAVVAAVVSSGVFALAVVGAGYGWWSTKAARAEVLEHEAAANALLEAGKVEECVDYVMKHPPSRELLGAGLNCAYRDLDWDAVETVCSRWRTADLPYPPPDDTCDSYLVRHSKLMTERRYEECLALALKQPETERSLVHQLACASSAEDVEATDRACRTLMTKYPHSPSSAGCEGLVSTMRLIDGR